MKIELAVEMMREFGRVAKRRGYIKCNSDLVAGLGAYKMYATDDFCSEDLKKAYLTARDYVAKETLIEMEKDGRGDEWVDRAKAGEVMRIC